MKLTPTLLIIFYISNIYTQSFHSTDLKKRVYKTSKEEITRENKNEYYTKDEFILMMDKEKMSFLKESKPSPESELSIYLKSKLTEKDLKKVNYNNIQNSFSFKTTPLKYKTYDYTIRLSFEINKKNKAWNLRVQTGNSDLNKKIENIFKNYPIEKFNLNEKNKLGKNTVQLFSREKKKTIINASNFVVLDEKPTIELCSDIKYYSKKSSCLYDDMYNYILENISLSVLSKQKKRGEIKIYPRFSIDSKGNIYKVNSIAPNKAIKKELDRIIKLYDRKLTPSKRNGIPRDYFYSSNYVLIVDKN